ncbi:hypothetical protein F2Q69_00013793 [Brassica cretica]|uniref:Uncharacterized protein n=1 Tax=Brassica cretica TaxID=69181 RepID=A0A8S9QVQ9_BRACR|nr:hypothetical protein F2Q69_00013793 [Brassica cretica]
MSPRTLCGTPIPNKDSSGDPRPRSGTWDPRPGIWDLEAGTQRRQRSSVPGACLDASVASRACYPLIPMLVDTAPGAEGNHMLLKGDSRLGPGVGRNQRLETAEPNAVEEGFQVTRALDLMRVSRFLPPGDRSHLFYGAHGRNRWWSSRYAAGSMELRYALMSMECPCRCAGYRGLGQGAALETWRGTDLEFPREWSELAFSWIHWISPPCKVGSRRPGTWIRDLGSGTWKLEPRGGREAVFPALGRDPFAEQLRWNLMSTKRHSIHPAIRLILDSTTTWILKPKEKGGSPVTS